jgi:hypothetical protein
MHCPICWCFNQLVKLVYNDLNLKKLQHVYFRYCFIKILQGIYQKAQALYYQGDFEMALVFYHRGHKLRPELQEFRLGIQKAQEAIDNSVGCKSTKTVFPNITDFRPPVKKRQRVVRRRTGWSLDKVLSYKPSSSSFPPSNSNMKSSQKGKYFSLTLTLSSSIQVKVSYLYIGF